jgi:hypothetical protein
MRSIEPRRASRDLFHFHSAEPDWRIPPWPGTGWSSGMDVALEAQCNAGNDWEKYWIDLGGEG